MPAQLTPIDFAKQELAQNVREPECYARYCGGRIEAWCADFVSWCYVQAGAPLPGYTPPTLQKISRTASCSYVAGQMRDRGLLLDASITPQVNDMIFYKYVDPKTRSNISPGPFGLPFVYGHIGIVEGIDGDKVVSVEGNVSNKVARVRTRLNSPSIGAYGRFFSPAGTLQLSSALRKGPVVPVLVGGATGFVLWRAYKRLKRST